MADCVLQGVDIFSKDFLFIPIHEALHWSLVIVCYPGRVVNGKLKKPSVIHLDSMAGGAAASLVLHCLLNGRTHTQSWPFERGEQVLTGFVHTSVSAQVGCRAM